MLFMVTKNLAILSKKNSILISTMDVKTTILTEEGNGFTVQSTASYHKNFDILVKDLERWKK